MATESRIRVGVSSGTDLIRQGLRELLRTHGSAIFVLVDEEPAEWTTTSVDVVVLDLTHHRVPPAGHFSPVWKRRIPTLGLISASDEHHAAMVVGCQQTLVLNFSAAEFDAAASRLKDMARCAVSAEPTTLSWRELQVVHLVASGHSNQAVAHHLLIGENTVKTYIRQAYRKMNVLTRSQATVWAYLNSLTSASASKTLFDELAGPRAKAG